jgi:N-methylhydantoinase A
MQLHVDKAHASFEAVASKLGMSVAAAASSALRLGVANIVRALQLVSTEKGRDPRDYALVPFGGAGPLLAAEIAEEMGIATVVVPPNPGVLSAYGLIASDFSKIYAATRRFVVDDAAADQVRAAFAAMEAEGRKDFAGFGLSGALDITFTADMRFVGQAFEVPVPLDLARLAKLDRQQLVDAFVEAHHRIFLHGAAPTQKIEVVGFRLEISRSIDTLPAFREKRLAPKERRRAQMTGPDGPFPIDVHSCPDLPVDRDVNGPALLEGYSSATYLPAGWRARRDANDNLVLTRAK